MRLFVPSQTVANADVHNQRRIGNAYFERLVAHRLVVGPALKGQLVVL